MIAASANIPYNRCSRPSFIFWPAVVSGVGFHTTTPNGRASTITTINGEWKGGWSIFMADFCLLTGIETKYKSHIITVYE